MAEYHCPGGKNLCHTETLVLTQFLVQQVLNKLWKNKHTHVWGRGCMEMHLSLLVVMLCGFLSMTKDLRKINLTGIMACSGSQF